MMMNGTGGGIMFAMGAICLLAVAVLLVAAAALVKYLRSPGTRMKGKTRTTGAGAVALAAGGCCFGLRPPRPMAVRSTSTIARPVMARR